MAVRPADGAALWQRFVEESGTRPLVRTGSTAATVDGADVVGLAPATGELRWSVRRAATST